MIFKTLKNANLAVLSGMALIKLNCFSTNAINHRDDFLNLISMAIEKENFSQLNEFKKWVSLNIASLGEESLFSIINEANSLSEESLMERFNKTYPYSKNGSASLAHSNDLDTLAVSLIGVSENDTFLDPTAEFDGAWLSVLKQNRKQQITLQTLSPLEACFAYLNKRINDGKNVRIYTGNVLTNPQYIKDNNLVQFDRIITYPPLGTKFAPEAINNSFNRFKYGKIISANVTWGFVSNVLASLKLNGKAAVFVGNGDLFGSASRKTVRNNILNNDLIETVISFPSGFVDNTSASVNLLVLNTNKKQLVSKVLFIDANQKRWLQREKNSLSLTAEGAYEIKKLVDNPDSIVNISKIEKIENCQESLMPSSHIIKNHLRINDVEYYIDNSKLKKLNTIPLGKVAAIQRGFNMIEKNQATQSNYKILKVSNLEENEKIDYSRLSNVTVGPNTRVDVYQVHKNDIVISVRGSNLGKVIYISEEPKENTLITSNLAIIRTHDIEAEWLYLYLKSTLAKYFIKKISRGTTVKILPITDLKKLPLTKVSKEEQVHTVKVNHESIQEIRKLQQELINKQKNLAHKINVLVGNDKVVFPDKTDIDN